MKNLKITATKGQVNNTAVTAKNTIRPSVSKKVSATSNAVDQVNAEDLTFADQVANPNKMNEETQLNEVTNNEPIVKPSKVEIKAELTTKKPALNLEQTLSLVQFLAERTAHRTTYLGYIETLEDFVVAQNDDDMGKDDDPSFKGCELMIHDGQGNVFTTKSPSVIFGTVSFMKGRFIERLAEVEAEIKIPV